MAIGKVRRVGTNPTPEQLKELENDVLDRLVALMREIHQGKVVIETMSEQMGFDRLEGSMASVPTGAWELTLKGTAAKMPAGMMGEPQSESAGMSK